MVQKLGTIIVLGGSSLKPFFELGISPIASASPAVDVYWVWVYPRLMSLTNTPTDTPTLHYFSNIDFWGQGQSVESEKYTSKWEELPLTLDCIRSRGGHSTFFQVGVCGPDFRSVGLANWHLPLKRGACERKISKFGGLWAENFQIWGLVRIILFQPPIFMW